MFGRSIVVILVFILEVTELRNTRDGNVPLVLFPVLLFAARPSDAFDVFVSGHYDHPLANLKCRNHLTEIRYSTLKQSLKNSENLLNSKRKRSSELAGQAAGEGGKKKRSKRKGKKKGKKKKKSRKEKSALSSDDEVSLRPGRKPVGPAEQHFNQ